MTRFRLLAAPRRGRQQMFEVGILLGSKEESLNNLFYARLEVVELNCLLLHFKICDAGFTSGRVAPCGIIDYPEAWRVGAPR